MIWLVVVDRAWLEPFPFPTLEQANAAVDYWEAWGFKAHVELPAVACLEDLGAAFL